MCVFQGHSPDGDFPPGEVWFEHLTADGKVYYSHPKTQKTVWERPKAHIVPYGSKDLLVSVATTNCCCFFRWAWQA